MTYCRLFLESNNKALPWEHSTWNTIKKLILAIFRWLIWLLKKRGVPKLWKERPERSKKYDFMHLKSVFGLVPTYMCASDMGRSWENFLDFPENIKEVKKGVAM